MVKDIPGLRFGDWCIEPQLNQITRGNTVRRLEPKVMDVLMYLLARPGTVVPAAELLEHVWAGLVVEQSTVHRRISQLRRALGDDAKHPTYIASIVRRGYRAIAPVSAALDEATANGDAIPQGRTRAVQRDTSERSTATTTPAPASAAEPGDGSVANPTPADTKRRLAVLALRDLSPDQDLGWLAGGLTEHLSSQLATLTQIKVVPRSLIGDRTANDMAEDLDLLIDGFVQGRGNDVMVQLDLVDIANKATLWHHAFHGRHDDPFELQLQIATHMARFFGESIAAPFAPQRPEAYGAFLRTLNNRFYGNLDDSLHWLQRTLELDPHWSYGWSDLAMVLLRTASSQRDQRFREQAREILATAERPPDSEANFVQADYWLRAYWDNDLEAAEATARRYAERWNGSAYAMLMLSSGLFDEAEDFFVGMTEFAPYIPLGWEMLTMARANQNDWSGALAALRNLVRLFPPESINALGLLGRILPRAGQMDEAHAVVADYQQRVAQLKPGSKQRQMAERTSHGQRFELARAEGDEQTARDCARWCEQHGMATHAGLMYLALGDAQAETLLTRAPEPHFDRFWWWQTRLHVSAAQREHPLFRQVEDALGFTHQWRYELARRAATLGRKAHIHCDPSKYAMD